MSEWNAALEEAAKVCEEAEDSVIEVNQGAAELAFRCKINIRALKRPETEPAPASDAGDGFGGNPRQGTNDKDRWA